MLIESDPDDTSIITRALKETKPECRVSVAKDVDQAVALLSGQTSPALVALGLPWTAASSFLGWINRNRSTGRFPVVVLNGLGSVTELKSAYDLGANSCLPKPQEPGVLYETACWIARYWLRFDQFSAGRWI